MRAVAQRVSKAKVTVSGEVAGEIETGIMLLLGVGRKDTQKDADYVLNKTLNLRVFEDQDGRMNRSLLDIDGGLLVVSQFTLHGDVRKGLRPSFIKAADPKEAEILYEYFLKCAKSKLGSVGSGRFRKMMEVELVNNGPVTILIDSERDF